MAERRIRGKTVIGWTELVDLPLWEINGLDAKIDTGARTSALHVENLRPVGRNRVAFDVIVGRRAKRRSFPVEAPVERWAAVRSSTGEEMDRPFIRTRVRLGMVEKEIEVSLVSRHSMLFRMLIGRKALEDDFLVDVSLRKTLSKDRKQGTR